MHRRTANESGQIEIFLYPSTRITASFTTVAAVAAECIYTVQTLTENKTATERSEDLFGDSRTYSPLRI